MIKTKHYENVPALRMWPQQKQEESTNNNHPQTNNCKKKNQPNEVAAVKNPLNFPPKNAAVPNPANYFNPFLSGNGERTHFFYGLIFDIFTD